MQLFLVVGEEFSAQDLSVFSGSFEEVEANAGGGLCVYVCVCVCVCVEGEKVSSKGDALSPLSRFLSKERAPGLFWLFIQILSQNSREELRNRRSP